MEKMNSSVEKTLSYMIYGALIVLSLGLLTSPTILALSHILMIFPMIYFLNKADYKIYPKSAWALLALTIVLICSVIFNQDIAVKAYAPLTKIKYFLFGFLMIAPLNWFFKNHLSEKKMKWLIGILFFSTTIATLCGLSGTFFGYIPLANKVVEVSGRYGGLFGMVMNYAHNMAYFLVIPIGLLLNYKQVKKYIDIKFLILVLAINLFGFYYSYTRGAWLALVCAVPFFFFKKNKKYFIATFILLVILGAGVFYTAGSNVIRSRSESQRIGQWLAAMKAFEERPILGFGYLNFEPHSGELKKKYELGHETFVSHAHNNFLEIGAVSGILGLICFTSWLFFWLKESFRGEDLFSKIGFVFILVFLVGGMTQSTLTLGINLFFIFGVYSLQMASMKNELKNEKGYLE